MLEIAAGLLTAFLEPAVRRYPLRPASLLAAAGLRQEDLNDASAFLPMQAFVDFMRALRERTGDPALGVHLAEELDLRRQGFWGYALLSSTTFRERLDLHVRYQRLRSPFDVSFRVEGETGILGIEPRGLPMDLVPILLDCGYASGIMHLRRHFRDDMTGVRLQLPYPRRPYHTALERLLLEPVVFNALRAELHFPAAKLDQPLDGDPNLRKLAVAQLDAQLAQAREADVRSLPDELRERLRSQLTRNASLDSLACALGVSPRTLQRQLVAHGVSFQSLLDEVRFSEALRYLSESDDSVDMIAKRLGYGDVSSFRRAFRRWTGLPPAVYRDKRARAAASGSSNDPAEDVLAQDARLVTGNGPVE